MVGLLGPTFPDLRLIAQEDLETASWIFTTGSIGKYQIESSILHFVFTCSIGMLCDPSI